MYVIAFKQRHNGKPAAYWGRSAPALRLKNAQLYSTEAEALESLKGIRKFRYTASVERVK